MFKFRTFAAKALKAAALLCLVSSCAGTTTGNPNQPLVAVQFASYVAQTKPSKPSFWKLFIPTADASVTDLRLCLKRLRFKQSASSPTGENHDLALGEIQLGSSGNSFTSVFVAPGTYNRIEFDIDPSCSTARSASVTNSNGTFNSTDTMTIRFDGTFTVSSANQVLTLATQSIVTNLRTATSGPSIKTLAESSGGTF